MNSTSFIKSMPAFVVCLALAGTATGVQPSDPGTMHQPHPSTPEQLTAMHQPHPSTPEQSAVMHQPHPSTPEQLTAMEQSHPSTPEILPLVVFNNSDVRWQIVNDGVMGGLSRSRLVRTGEGNALFSGEVSLRNNGGFASVRAPLQVDLHEYEGIHMRIRGDSQWYNFRLYTRVNGRVSPWAYEASFQSPGEEWVDVYLPFEVFGATYRGSAVPNAPALDPASIAVVGIMIKDRQQGPFTLEVASIGAWRSAVVSGS